MVSTHEKYVPKKKENSRRKREDYSRRDHEEYARPERDKPGGRKDDQNKEDDSSDRQARMSATNDVGS